MSDVASDGAVRSSQWLIEQVVSLWEELVVVHEKAEDHFRLRPQSIEAWRNYLETRLLRDHEARVCVAVENRRVIGFLVARLERPAPMFLGEPYGFISDCFVRPENRAQGVTVSLFKAAVDWLAGKGVSELQLDVYNRNTEAFNYWLRRGFRPLKTRMVLDLP